MIAEAKSAWLGVDDGICYVGNEENDEHSDECAGYDLVAQGNAIYDWH